MERVRAVLAAFLVTSGVLGVPGVGHASPSNDAFAGAQNVTLGEVVRGSTMDASAQSSEFSECGATELPSGGGAGPFPFTEAPMSVWYRLAATAGDRIEVSIPWVWPSVDVRGFVIRDGVLVPILCGYATADGAFSDAFTLRGDGPVYLRLSTSTSEQRATFDLLVLRAEGNPEERPYANAEPSTATPVELPFTADVMPEFADQDLPPYVPERAGYPPPVDVWYKIRPASSMLITVTGWTYNGPPVLEVYASSDPSRPLAEAHTAYDPLHGDNDGAHLAVALDADTEYLVRAGRGRRCVCERLWLRVEAAPQLDLSTTVLVESSEQGALHVSGSIEGHPFTWDSIFSTSPVWVQVEIDPVGDAPPFVAPEREAGHSFRAWTFLPGCTGSYDVTVRLVPRHHREIDSSNDTASTRITIDDGPTVPACLLTTPFVQF